MKSIKNYLILLGSFYLNLVVAAQTSADYILLTGLPSQSQIEAIPIVEISNLSPLQQPSNIRMVSNNIAYLELSTPPVGNQGAQASCSTWASCYAAASVFGHSKYGNWEEGTMSPSFLYNRYKLSDDCSEGCFVITILQRMQQEGVCSLRSFPYNVNSCSALPNESEKFEAYLNRCEYGRLAAANNVSLYKNTLQRGYPIIVDFFVYHSFDSIWDGDGIWNKNYKNDSLLRGAHSACVVGYDDTRNLFKVQNSWGTSGGDNGYFWVTYELVESGCFYAAYVLTAMSSNRYPSIVGNDILCDSAEYYVENLPDRSTVAWGYQGEHQSPVAIPFIYHAIDSVTAIYQRGYMPDNSDTPGMLSVMSVVKPYVGRKDIYANITTPTSNIRLAKNIDIGTSPKPAISPVITSPVRKNRIITFSETACTTVDDNDLVWDITLGNGNTIHTSGRSFPFFANTPGITTITVTNLDACAPDNSLSITFLVLATKLMISDDSHVLTIEGLDNINDESYLIEVWDEFGSNVYSTYGVDSVFRISKPLSPGLYTIQLIKANGERIQLEKLLIN